MKTKTIVSSTLLGVFALGMMTVAAGLSAVKQGECEAVCELPSPSLAPSPMEQAYIFYNRGLVYEAKDDQGAALGHFEEAYRILPTHPTIRAKLEQFGLPDA